MHGLDEGRFTGLMDNSTLKHGKRLYGTSLICRKPEDVVGRTRDSSELPLRIFINVASYNHEVESQLRSMNATIECVLL